MLDGEGDVIWIVVVDFDDVFGVEFYFDIVLFEMFEVL